MWSSTRILWDQQILLLWILLPPVFLACGLLVFAAPLLYREKAVPKADNDLVTDDPGVIAESPQRKAVQSSRRHPIHGGRIVDASSLALGALATSSVCCRFLKQ